jgi:hypothetical protein
VNGERVVVALRNEKGESVTNVGHDGRIDGAIYKPPWRELGRYQGQRRVHTDWEGIKT